MSLSEYLITIIHPTARVKPSDAFPEGWREAARVWYERAADPSRIQYLLACHESRWDDLLTFKFPEGKGDIGNWNKVGADGVPQFELVQNTKRDCAVDQVNACLDRAKGKLIVISQDDMFPPQNWDMLLMESLERRESEIQSGVHGRISISAAELLREALTREAVLHVSSASATGELPERNDELFNPQILTTARARRLGYIGYPEYTAPFSDDEFSEHARKDGCVIDARHIVFEHRHPIFGGKVDDIYHNENSIEGYRIGLEVLMRRRAAGFPSILPKPPKFSLIHTTARLPGGWLAAHDAWLAACDHPEDVEYVVAIDARDKDKWPGFPTEKRWGHQVLTINEGRTCAVDGWNAAGKASTGQFLITVADDFRPCAHWDTEISKAVPDMSRQAVLDVDYGPKATPHFFYFSLFTRARYERLGYVFWHEYWGMWGDNDFTDHAVLDRVVVDATHLTFPHLHASYGLSEEDDVYRWQQRPMAYQIGAEVFAKRKATGFPPLDKMGKPKLMVFLPGETFSSRWVSAWDSLRCFLAVLFDVQPVWAVGTSVYVVRNVMARQAREMGADYVLCLDDDNILEPKQFLMMYEDLRAHDSIGLVACWCWTQSAPDGFVSSKRHVSAGWFDQKGNCVRVKYEDMMQGAGDLIEFEWSGFPCVLMPRRTLDAVGKNPFTAFLSDDHEFGMSGEDTSFCKRVLAAGLKVVVDRRLRIPHLKLSEVDPPEPEEKPEAKAQANGKLSRLKRAGSKVLELMGAG